MRPRPGHSARSYETITKVDLRRLSEIAEADRKDLFSRKPHLRHYRHRIICVALCQGAALHYLDGTSGVKDFDVWTFYSELHVPFPARRNASADFGPSMFGRYSQDVGYEGRRVDLIGRSLPVRPRSDPLQVIQDYLSQARTQTARKLAEKAVVIIDPVELRGRVAWER